jgi:hypothetical protein
MFALSRKELDARREDSVAVWAQLLNDKDVKIRRVALNLIADASPAYP